MEASLVMSLVLFAVMVLLSFFSILDYQIKAQFWLDNVVRESAIQDAGKTETEEAEKGTIAETGRVNLAIKSALRKADSMSLMELGNVEIIVNPTEEEDYLDAAICYDAGPVLRVFGTGKITYLQRSRRRRWTGQQYIGGQDSSDCQGGENYVYITQNGSVYHKNRECSYLEPSIQGIMASSVETRRNTDGERYKACESCLKNADSLGTYEMVYITDWGNRYHRSRGCSGLKRWIIKILHSEVGLKKPCSRCGG